MVRNFNRFIIRLQRIFLVSASWHFDLFCKSYETILSKDIFIKKSRSINRAAFFILTPKVLHLNKNKFRADDGELV